MKSAAHHLIKFGLNYYIIQQLRLEQAKQLKQKAVKPDLHSLNAINGYIAAFKKKKQEEPL
ncbi:MAG: hypothetical protein WAU62_10015 [Dehalococcoidales bacterium]|jgi:hypothetical protein